MTTLTPEAGHVNARAAERRGPHPSLGIPDYLVRLDSANHDSQMNTDALAILRAARQLKHMVREFGERHDCDEGERIREAAGITLADRVPHPLEHSSVEWAYGVYEDVSGFEWVLGRFITALWSELYGADDDDDVAAAVVAEKGGAL